MALDSNLLYGEMVGSFLAHMAIPLLMSMLVGVLPYMMLQQKLLVFLALCVGLSFVCQLGFLTIMQAISCQGIKDVRSIATGAGIAACITAVMIAIPAFVEPMRLVVSQLFMTHKTLLTPELAKINDILIDAGDRVMKASIPAKTNLDNSDPMPLQTGGAAITVMEYEAQTFQEITNGVMYWSGFAGAYGIGLGSLLAAKCPATS